MHSAHQYINKYKETTKDIKKIIYEIEILLDQIYLIISVSSVNELIKFYHEIYKDIENNVDAFANEIEQQLNDLQNFCYSDIKDIIPNLEGTKYLNEEEAFKLAKNINWLTEQVLDENLEYELKNRIENIISFNKRVRNLIHDSKGSLDGITLQTSSHMIEENIEKQEFEFSIEQIIKELTFNFKATNRLKELLHEYYIAGENEHINKEIFNFSHREVIKYIERFKNRCTHINIGTNQSQELLIENKVEKGRVYMFMIYDLYELIDNVIYLSMENNTSNFLNCKIYENGNDKCTIEFLIKSNSELPTKNVKRIKNLADKFQCFFECHSQVEYKKLILTFPVEIKQNKKKKNIVAVMLEEESKKFILQKYKVGNTLVFIDTENEVDLFKTGHIFLEADIVLLKTDNKDIQDWLIEHHYKGEIEYV